MASISRDPGGCRRILFVAPDGARKAVYLGKTSQRSAEAVKYRVEQLLESRLTGRALPAELRQAVVEALRDADLR